MAFLKKPETSQGFEIEYRQKLKKRFWITAWNTQLTGK